MGHYGGGRDYIRLIQEDGPDGLWLADMSETTKAETIHELFGAYILPTPFLAVTPYWVVEAEILKGNPGAKITHEGDNG